MGLLTPNTDALKETSLCASSNLCPQACLPQSPIYVYSFGYSLNNEHTPKLALAISRSCEVYVAVTQKVKKISLNFKQLNK